MQIPLKNRLGDIIDYTIVSNEDYQLLNKYKWYKANTYAKSTINGKSWSLHRFVIIEILKNIIPDKNVVDHINNNSMDNTRENLRIITFTENSRNKKKKENCSSKYTGVSIISAAIGTGTPIWKVSTKVGSKTLSAFYDNEEWAGFHYNLWIDEFGLKNVKNNIVKPENFIRWEFQTKKKYDLPLGISIQKGTNKFVAFIGINKIKKHLGTFNTCEEAVKARQIAEKEYNEDKQNKLLAIPKEFNENGFCFFKVKETEIIIDEEIFYDIIKYNWQIRNKYPRVRINGILTNLSRYIMNYHGNNVVDHINGNTYDNRKENLRIITAHQNNMNRIGGGLSKYIGVHSHKKNKKWVACIYYDSKRYYLGSFTDEIEAAKARDIATLKYFGEYGKLNFPQIIE